MFPFFHVMRRGIRIFHVGISRTWDFSFFNVMDRTHPETEHTPKRDFHFSISRNDYVNRTDPAAPGKEKLHMHLTNGEILRILQYMKNTSKLSQYVVRPCPYSSRGFAIVNLVTGAVMEAGFFSRTLANEYLWREYQQEETV